MPCPVCGEPFEFAASGSDVNPWPPDETMFENNGRLDIDERTPSGSLRVCRHEPQDNDITFYVHHPRADESGAVVSE